MMGAKAHEADLIGTEELKEKLERGDDFKLVMVLGKWEYRAKHIAGSLRVSTPEEGLEALNPGDEIVLSTTLALPAPQAGWPAGSSKLTVTGGCAATPLVYRSGRARGIRWKANTSNSLRKERARAGSLYRTWPVTAAATLGCGYIRPSS